MRTLLCCACMQFVTTPHRTALTAMRDHVLDAGHDMADMRCVDVESTARRLVGELGAKARR